MIRPQDTNLTSTEYNLIRSGAGDPIYQIVAHDDSLSFASLGHTGAASDNLDHATYHDGNYIFRVVDGQMDRYDTVSNTLTVCSNFVPPSGVDTAKRAAITKFSDQLRVFVVHEDSIKMAYSLDDGDTWSNWATVLSVPKAYNYTYSTDRCNGGTASASSVLLGDNFSYGPANAFDNTPSTQRFTADGVFNEWLQYTHTSPVWITSYTLTARDSQQFAHQNPKWWQFQYYNGSSWVTVHEVKDAPAWEALEMRTYYIVTPAAGINGSGFTQWRILFKETHGDEDVVSLGQVEMFETIQNVNTSTLDNIACPAPDTLYYVQLDPAWKLYQPYRLTFNEYGDADAASASGLRFQFRPDGLDAIRLDDGTDVILYAADLPGDMTYENEGTELIAQFFTAQGLGVLQYANGTWSQPIWADTVLNRDETNFLTHAHLQRVNDLLVITARSSSGSATYPIVGLRYYTSLDGRWWSNGNVLMASGLGGTTGGVTMAAEGDYIYVFESESIHRGLSCFSLGHSPASRQIDITELVSDYQLHQEGATVASFTIDDDERLFAYDQDQPVHAILNQQDRIIFEHKAGRYVNGYGEIMVRVALTVMDSIEWDYNLPEWVMRVSARDFTAFMSDRVTSEKPVYNHSQLVTGDNYADRTDTAYGGMAHTAIHKGDWKTLSGVLTLVTENKIGLVFNTQSAGMWNGEFSSKINLTTGEGGLIFRALDLDNYHYLKYKKDGSTYTLSIGEQRGENPLLYKEVTIATIPNYLKIVFNMGLFEAYTSSDGITWNKRMTIYHDCTNRVYGAPYKREAADVPIDKGSCGLFGRGTGISFDETFIVDYTTPMVVEDAITFYAALAGIFTVDFDAAFVPDGTATPDAGTTVTTVTSVQWGDGSTLWNDGSVWG